MSFGFALGLLVVVFGIIMVPSMVFHVAVQPLFLISWSVCIVVLNMKGFSFDELQAKSSEYIRKAVNPILIMMASGMMIGAMNICGTMPYMTMLGMSVISPSVLLPVTFVLTFVTAYLTGTVFGAIGTVGIVFLSIARGMQVPDIYAVSAIYAGGFMGYFTSPLGELPPLIESILDIKADKGLKELNQEVFPPLILCGIIYFFINRYMVSVGIVGEMTMNPMDIMDGWKSSPLLIVPMLILIIIMFMRKPTVLPLTAGAVAGAVVAVLYQGRNIADTMASLWTGPVPPEGQFAYLFSRGGIQSMSGTILLFIGSFGLFGLLDAGHVVTIVFGVVTTKMNNLFVRQFGMVAVGFFMTVFCASATCALLFTSSFFKPVFEEKGWDMREVVRASILGGVAFSPYVPWHSNCVTPCSMLGVDPAARMPLLFYPWVMLLWLGVMTLFKAFEKRK